MVKSIASLLLLSLFTSTSLASDVEVISNILDDDTLNNTFEPGLQTPTASQNYLGRQNGKTTLLPSFVRKIQVLSGLLPVPGEDGTIVQTTVITQTSQRHVDYYSAESEGAERLPVHRRVGFVLLNSNEDAYFDHGDTSIPIVSGSFVHFEGDVPHNTIVKSGSVKMLGPFDLMSFKSAGVVPQPDPPSDLPSFSPLPSLVPSVSPAPSLGPSSGETAAPSPAMAAYVPTISALPTISELPTLSVFPSQAETEEEGKKTTKKKTGEKTTKKKTKGKDFATISAFPSFSPFPSQFESEQTRKTKTGFKKGGGKKGGGGGKKGGGKKGGGGGKKGGGKKGGGGGKKGGGKNDGGKRGGGKNDGGKNDGGKKGGGKNDGGKNGRFNNAGKNDRFKNDGGKNGGGKKDVQGEFKKGGANGKQGGVKDRSRFSDAVYEKHSGIRYREEKG